MNNGFNSVKYLKVKTQAHLSDLSLTDEKQTEWMNKIRINFFLSFLWETCKCTKQSENILNFSDHLKV